VVVRLAGATASTCGGSIERYAGPHPEIDRATRKSPYP